MKTLPQSQPMHHVLFTYTPEPRHSTFPSHLSYNARKECQISKTGLGRSRLHICFSPVLSATALLKAIGTNNLQQRKTRILPRHLQTAEIDGMCCCAHERFFCLSILGFRSFRRDADDAGIFLPLRHKVRVINPLQKTLQPGTSEPLWHNLRKWATSDTSQREQQKGTARRDLEKIEKPRMDRNDFGVYVRSVSLLAFLLD